MRQPANVDATFYVQVEPDWSPYRDGDGDRLLRGARAVRITKSRPSRPVAGTVLVKLTVRLPGSAFLPLRPEAVITVPESLTVATPLEVIAEDPTVTA